ncbi:hypothetical protein IVB12_11115 [Bradyrhizobium sp. 179]|uniref:hypothetical protein n=1 Tax=Bradyrhizobium sp. 179 TaxID=2782648 RepID=UPI001FFA4804|nr:hypothetical protein [Bradyrhizobium sp. 179]MCK1542484.1 hypothetical protein [Bradyrhizobium sp. 179]
MRTSLCGLLFSLWGGCAALGQDAKEIERWAATLSSERVDLVVCLSALVDRAKAQGISETEFKNLLAKSCQGEFERLQKAILERVSTPGIEGTKRDELAVAAGRLLLIPIFNEFSGKVPYRYRLIDRLKGRISPTVEDIAFKAAKEDYSECLSKAARDARAAGISVDAFKDSLGSVCLQESEAIRRAELAVWDTYARPPQNRDAAGNIWKRSAQMNAVRQFSDNAK